MSGCGQLSRLLLHVHRASAAPETWEQALGHIAAYLRCTTAALVLHDFRLAKGAILSAIGYDAAYVRSYADCYAAANVWLRDEGRHRAAGMVAVSQDLVPVAELVASPFYTEWLEPQNLYHRMGAVIWRDDHDGLLLEVMRPPERGPFAALEVGRVRRLLPHLQQAYLLHRRLTQAGNEADSARRALDALPTGVLIVGENGVVLLANHRANAMLAAADGLMLQGGRLAAANPAETCKLLDLVSGAVATATGTAMRFGRAVALSRHAGDRNLHVRIVPVLYTDIRRDEQVAAALIFIVDPETPIGLDEDMLGELFGLTRVESRLASLIAQGRSTEEAATALSIAVNTARCYLKRIFDKTGVRRQSELVRLVLLGLAG